MRKKEIFSKIALFNECFQISIGSGDGTHIGRYRFAIADTLDGVAFQYPQQLDLGGYGQIADFVEENVALGCRFKPAGPVTISTGKSPLNMPEQLIRHL